MRTTAILGICVIALLAAACSHTAEPAPALRSAGPSVTGREVRYNAVLALAHRGSKRLQDAGVWDVLLEMLDENEQLQNYTPRSETGKGVPDETAARTTVISALQAVEEFHRKEPKTDLSGLKEPIEKLTRSSNATVSVQARQAMDILFPKG
jgi:hypothetical protein